MKALRNYLDKIKPNFEKGGKLEKLHSVFDGMESLMFVPKHNTHNGSHIRDSIDLKRTMFMVIIAMIPALLFGMYNVGHQHFLAIGQFTNPMDGFIDKLIYGSVLTMPIVAVSYGVGLGIEFVFAQIRGHAIQEGFLVSGMLIPLIMPVEVPLWMVAIATSFAVIIGKEVFGGTGMNILNPALTARAFLFFAYPTKMSGNKVWINTDVSGGEALVDGYSGETFLAQSIESSSNYVNVAGQAYESTSEAFMNAFWGFVPGSIGETSAVAILIGAAILLISGIGSWRIMLSFFVGGYVMGLLFNAWGANEFMNVDALHQTFIGGFFFGMVFIATDPVSAAQTDTGKWIYGFLAGFFGIMIRVFNPAYPEGIMMSILFMNVMAPLIDHYVIQSNIGKRLKRAEIA